MTCQACGAAVAADARFCAACGAPVVRGCAGCGADLPPAAQFCPSCGRPLDPSSIPASAPGQPDAREAPAPARERKIATLLFADLVGFTAIGEAHDPEIVGALVGEVFGRLAAEIERYEGTLEKFAGDALLAVFGVPAVHEDDPERAVRAALEMQAAMGELAAGFAASGRPPAALRIGVETGEVLVDVARAAAQRDLFVTGDAVNVAARLQQAAEPGAVTVGPATYAATRHVIDYVELPTDQVKGRVAPVAAWRAVAVKARRRGQRAPLGLESPIVGRDEELSLLKETVRRTVADGRPHLVTVIGAPGAGKSRLSWELEKYLDGLPETYHWRKGRCLAYAQASYSALADVIKADAGIMDDDAPQAALSKLEARARDVHGDAPDPAIETALQSVLALGEPASLPREQLFEAWRRHVDAVARLAPLVLVLEDIHWADEGLLDVIEFLARWGEAPVTILCLARHELLERRPSWGGGVLNAATIVLEPLDGQEIGRLVDSLLGSALPAALRDRIVTLADGNPLFAEELVRMFVDRGVVRHTDGGWEVAEAVETLEIPGSVQAVLAARLDGLPPAEKRLAQTAAVVGRIFWDAVLAHLAGQGPGPVADLLRRLRVKELVVPREPSSLAGAAEYAFRHVLIRDVAYDSLPKRDRASLHLDVATWAETALAERGEEFVELLAAHYVAALRYEEEFSLDPAALDDLRRRTLEQARLAARRAARLGQLDSATTWIRTAIDQARKLDVDPRLLADLVEDFTEFAWGTESGATAAPVVQDAVERLAAVPDLQPADRARLDSLRVQLGRLLYLSQRPEEARATLEAALADGPAPAERAMVLSAIGWLEWRLGRPDASIAPLEEAVSIAAAVGAERVERTAVHDLGVALSWHNDPRGHELLARSFELAKAAGDENLLTRCYINLPGTMMASGRHWTEIEPIAEEGLQRARRRVDRAGIAWIAGNLAELRWRQGRLAEAVALAREAADSARVIGDQELVASRQVGFALMLLLAGDRPGAAATLSGDVRRYASREPQTRPILATIEAWLAWPDAEAAMRPLLALELTPGLPNQEVAAATLARLGLRANRDGALGEGVARLRAAAVGELGPYMVTMRALADALEERGPDAVTRVGAIAERFVELGYPMPAADAYADAAFVAARHGLDGVAFAQRSRSLFAASGAAPPLGDPLGAVAAARAS